MTDSTDGMIVLTTTGQDEPDAGRTMAGGGGSDDLVITENPGAGVFEATRDGETVAGVVYSRSGDRVTLLAADPHSPNMARVNGPVRNIDAWYEAFNVKPGDKLYLPPEERVRIW